jgi:outer membrane protein OmpA-like peptidoglycan-associated protein
MASHRTWAAAAVVAAAVVLVSSRPAAAEPYQLGGFFGPRFFSENSAIGVKEASRTSLTPTVALGARLARPLYAWLVPEVELPLAVTTTREHNVTVLWLEPRAQVRFVWPLGKVRPHALLGFGVPMTSSTRRGIFGSDISWDPYGGIGGTFAPGRSVSYRLDIRVGITEGYRPVTPIAAEVEVIAGIYFDLDGGARKRKARTEQIAAPGDEDGDHLTDDVDACPDRPEDEDGFLDTDGCPDIDNDLDQVLDIADACPSVTETYNGFEDDDGCQDSIPGDVAAILGTVEGLLYNPGSTEVPGTAREALDKIAAVMKKFPSVQVVLLGHTDDREADIDKVEDESPEDRAQREAVALVDLSRERAAAVGDALVERGIGRGRVDAAGKGGDEPVSDNDTSRHRLRNRRVEVTLFIPAAGRPRDR